MSARHYNDWPNEIGFNTREESREPRELEVKGTFPPWVAGSLFRTGPATYKVETDSGKDYTCSHWFDGFSQTHRFDIVPHSDGGVKVHYTSRHQVDELLVHIRKTGRLLGGTFGQKRDPCNGIFQKVKSSFAPSVSRNPSLWNIGVAFQPTISPILLQHDTHSNEAAKKPSTMLCTSDMAATKEFDVHTLEPCAILEQKALHPLLDGPLSATHAPRDPVTGDIFNYNLKLGGSKCTYRIFKVQAATGNVDILATISQIDVYGAYIHSLFLTENYVILCVWPSYYAWYGAKLLWERNVLDAISKFDPTARTMWLVVDRRHGRGLVSRFTSPAFFAFHTVNAWEEKAANDAPESVDIVCELMQYKNLDIMHRFYYDNLVSTGPGVHDYSGENRWNYMPALARYRLPNVPRSSTKAETRDAQLLSCHYAGELPSINPRYSTRPHRYVYCLLDRGLSSFLDGIGKIDTHGELAPGDDYQIRRCTHWDYPKHTPGEPIFVPAPDAKAEDDGVLLSVVLDGEKGTSYLLCLDARDLKEVARAEVGVAVGLGFHGCHVPA